MSTTTKVTLATTGAWVAVSTQVSALLVVGPPSRYEVILSAAGLPAPATPGLPVTAIDGAFGTSAMATGDVLYARPWNRKANDAAIALSVMAS